MKLVKCYIENFGKISQKEFEFQSTMNVINQENGWGKTTLTVFLKAMLYGIEKNSKKKELSTREKYMPWNNGKYGGYLEIQIGDKNYRITRFFGETPKSDKFSLIDLSTNKESNDYTENIGEEIFGIDRDSYERSIFIPQQLVQTQISDSLTTKLTNLDSMQDDMNKYTEAQNKIAKKIDELKKKIKLNEKTLEEKNEQINKCNNAQLLFENYDKEKKEKELEYSQIKKKILENEHLLKKSNEAKLNQEILKQYENILKQEQEKNVKNKELEESFNGNIPTNIKIDEIKEEISNYEVSEKMLKEFNLQQLETKKQFILKTTTNEIDEMTLKYDKLKEEQEKLEKVNVLKEINNKNLDEILSKKNRFIVEIILIILGIVLAIVLKNKIIGLAIIGCGILYGAVKLVTSKNKKERRNLEKEKIKYENQHEDISKEIEELKAILNRFINKFDNVAHDNQIYEKLVNIKNNFAESQKDCNNYAKLLEESTIKKEKIEKFLMQYYTYIKSDYRTYLENLKEKIKEIQYNKIEIEKIENQKQEFMKEHDIEKLKNEVSVNENVEEIEILNSKLKQNEEILMQNIVSITRQMDSFSSIIEEKMELEEDVQNIEEELKSLNQYKTIAETTSRVLNKAKEKLSEKYLYAINKHLGKYINVISESNEFEKIKIDIDLNTSIEEAGEHKDIEYYSSGIKDLVAICTRFSIIEEIFKSEKPFIILDDPFVNLDDKKIKNGMKLLKEISNEYQIIYFTCHESRGN